MFNTTHTTPDFAASSRDRALESWRAAETLVWLRWQAFLAAADAGRPGAFACYVAALDAEELASDELALLSEIAA
jgi:hypothetical protein